MHLNLGDDFDGETLDVLLARCDYTNDDSVDMCELFDCLLFTENEYRAMNCPDTPKLVGCARPPNCIECPEAWTCDEIRLNVMKILEDLDKNNDNWIDYADYTEDDKKAVEMIMENCDENNDS